MNRTATLALLAILSGAACGGGGQTDHSDDGSAQAPQKNPEQLVDAALFAEQRRDCALVYSMLSNDSRRALSHLRRVEGAADAGLAAACGVISPHAGYESASRWEIISATVTAEAARVVTKVYGRECIDDGCDQTFDLVVEEGQWRFDLAEGLAKAATAPRPTATTSP